MSNFKIKIIFWFINILLLIFWFFALKYGFFYKSDDFAYNKLLSLYNLTYRNSIGWDKNIVLVKIDKKFFDKMWITPSTFHRWYYAQLLKKLQSYGVKNVVFDVFFQNLKYWTWNSKLQKIYNKSLEIFDNRFKKQLSWNIVLWVLPWYNNNKIIVPEKKFLKQWVFLWYTESHIDKWSINDWVYTYIKYKSWYIFSLWYEAYLNLLYVNWDITGNIIVKNELSNNIFSPNYLLVKTSNPKYDIKLPVTRDYNWWYFSFTPLFRLKSTVLSYSLYDVLTDKDNIYSDIFKNKTVFIWATDETLNDIKTSYLWIIPWVMFHINNFLSIKNWKYIYVLPYNWSFVILVIIFIIWFLFIFFFQSETLSIILFFILLVLLYLSSSYILLNENVILPIWTFVIILTIKLFIDILNILLISEKRKQFLNKLFNKYIWEKVLNKTDKNKWLRIAEDKKIALMFSDIASFTNISEKLTAKEVIQMLNIYFWKTNKPIIRSNWFIDKYVWDAIMAFWENVEYSDEILKSIIQIQKNHKQIMLNIKEKMWKTIDIYTRIWLHYGEAIVWDVWDINSKISYTAIWDNVNLASRLEWINKFYWTNIIISQTFYEKIKNKEEFALRLIDKITVKGKTEPINIYQVMNLYSFEITDDLKEYLDKFQYWLKFYFSWEFIKAKDIFQELFILKRWREDSVLRVLLDRIDYLLQNETKDWNGIWKFTSK